jgi:hypothetical protein
MTQAQKEVARELLSLSYTRGFESMHPLEPIAAKFGLTTAALYDKNTESGILFKYGPRGNGALTISKEGTHVGVFMDMREQLERWSDFKGI